MHEDFGLGLNCVDQTGDLVFPARACSKGFHPIEGKVGDFTILSVDCVDPVNSGLVRDAVADLDPLVALSGQILGDEVHKVRVERIIGLADALQGDGGGAKRGQPLGQVLQFRLAVRRQHIICIRVHQIQARIFEMIGAEHHDLDRFDPIFGGRRFGL